MKNSKNAKKERHENGNGRKVILRTESLKKEYPMGKLTVKALNGVSIEIREGEFVALMGPSGSGKTTLLNMLGLLDDPSSGEIFIDKCQISNLADEGKTDMRLEKLGYIFQFFNLINELTALENVELPLLLKGVPKKDADKKAMENLKLVGLAHRLDNKPNELSGGEQQRVAIARALINDPVLLLADEPTANLDSKTSEEIISLFRKLNMEHGKTIFMVTHETELGKRADRIIRLRDGVVEREEKRRK
ncbi:ABC transporter ATP-binding protein [archaeon]|nr:MAG: ABC transporter ATP-binding protein [archaeon]